MPHRLNCVPRSNGYDVWYAGRKLVEESNHPMQDAVNKLQRLGVEGMVELWSPDKPFMVQTSTIQ